MAAIAAVTLLISLVDGRRIPLYPEVLYSEFPDGESHGSENSQVPLQPDSSPDVETEEESGTKDGGTAGLDESSDAQPVTDDVAPAPTPWTMKSLLFSRPRRGREAQPKLNSIERMTAASAADSSRSPAAPAAVAEEVEENGLDVQGPAKMEQGEPGLQRETMMLSSTDGLDSTGAAQQEDARVKQEESALGEFAATMAPSARTAADLDVDISDLQADAKAIAMSGEQDADSNEFPIDGDGKQQGLGPELVASVAPLTNAGSLLQQQETSEQSSRNVGASFLTSLRAFSENSFNYVPSPLVGLLLGAALLTIASWLMSCCRFFWPQRFMRCFPGCETRHQYLHQGRVVYEWSQNMQFVTLYLRPPDGVSLSDLDIRISARHLRVGRKGRHCFLKEETFDLVNAERSSWSMERNGELHIIMMKVRRKQWPVAMLHQTKQSKSASAPVVSSGDLNSNLKPIVVT